MKAYTNPEGQYHRAKRWFWAAALSTGTCVLWFRYLNGDGCWLVLRGIRIALTLFFLPWLRLLLLLGFKMKGRIILIAFTIVGTLSLFWTTVDSSYIAMAESSAVGRLVQLQAALETDKVEHKEQGYLQNLPNLTSSYPVEKTYRFVYVPSRLPDGSFTSYLIQATSLCPYVVARETLPLRVAARSTSRLMDVSPQSPAIFCNAAQDKCAEPGLPQVN
jgi:hypothetical protein